MSAWIVWFIVAVVCIILEIFTPGFYLMSFGIGALFAGLVSFSRVHLVVQIIVFIIVSFLVFLWLKRYSKRMFDVTTDKTNVYALIGRKGVVSRVITQNKRGYVKVGGEEWPAIPSSESVEEIKVGETVIVQSLDGNKLLVALSDKEE
ncbi:MAG: NfeD family protein [Candidatus Cloacimonas sp.]|jgi:membrane protein implicated in regulation of membrane protease activity|nr:NfeD family protein [Candidatus Cloacimonadota bacterium]